MQENILRRIRLHDHVDLQSSMCIDILNCPFGRKGLNLEREPAGKLSRQAMQYLTLDHRIPIQVSEGLIWIGTLRLNGTKGLFGLGAAQPRRFRAFSTFLHSRPGAAPGIEALIRELAPKSGIELEALPSEEKWEEGRRAPEAGEIINKATGMPVEVPAARARSRPISAAARR